MRAITDTVVMALHIVMIIVGVVLAGWASIQTTQASPNHRINVFSGRWLQRPRLLLAVGFAIGLFAMFRLWRLDLGMWALLVWFVPFLIAMYLPIVRHNRSISPSS